MTKRPTASASAKLASPKLASRKPALSNLASPKPTEPTPPSVTAAPAAPRSAPGGKLGALVDLLRRPQGARIDQMMDATGWQAHSVRGAMAGALKKKHSLAVCSEKTEGGRVYRIAAGSGR